MSLKLEGFNPPWLDAKDIEIINRHDCGLCSITEEQIHDVLTRQDLIRFETAKKLVRWWVFLLYVYPTLCFEQVAPHFCDRGKTLEQYIDSEEFAEFQLELGVGYKAFGELWAEILDVDLTELVNVELNDQVRQIARDLMRLLAEVKAPHIITNNLYSMGDKLVLYWVIKRQTCTKYKNPWCFRYDLTQLLQHLAPSPSPESSGLSTTA
jgi:hypothetical protein